MSRVDELREEARPLLTAGEYAMRSCHRCNASHHYLTASEDGPLIVCYECGDWYYKGVNLSEDAPSGATPTREGDQ